MLAFISRVLLVPYAAAVALIVWLPGEQAGQVTGVVAQIARSLAHQLDVSFTLTYTVMEFLANIALFMPFGILLALAWPRLKVWHIAALGLLTSAVIEIVQMFLPTRFSTISDLIANTAGALLGCLIVRALNRLLSTPAPGRRSSVET